MKKMLTRGPVLLFIVCFFSFSKIPGGDVFELYLNGHKIHQQFVHADQNVKTLHLQPATGNDKLEIFYSHCGQAGKNRTITIRNENNGLIKALKYGDGKKNNSLMAVYRTDIGRQATGRIKIYYASDEIPAEKLLAVIRWNPGTATAALQ